jgi:serine/threonine-protein kinase
VFAGQEDSMPDRAPTETAAASRQRVVAGRYVLRAPIGAGGAARVFLADDVVLDRVVAVKLLDAEAAGSADPAGRDRFAREARSLATFRDPHVVMLLDAGDADGDLYVVLEYVDGGSLAELLARSAPLPIEVVVGLLDDVLAGLATVHRAGLVHRDVKPGNVLLTGDGRAKLADFGIARWLNEVEAHLTSPGTVIGTERYMAPERLAGGPVTVASDLFSVAVVAVEMLTGEPGASEGSRPSASELVRRRPDAPMPLVAAIHRALAADPRDRFASADEMASALTALAAAPTRTWAAPPPKAPASAPAPARERRVPRWPFVGAAAALVVAGVVALASALDGSDPGTASTGSTPSTVSATVAASAAPTAAPTTSPPSTSPPTTAATVTTPPPTAPATTAAELDELTAFITALQTGHDPAGQASKQLGDRLEKLAQSADELTGSGDEHAIDQWWRDAEKLLDDLDKWSEKGQLDITIAAEAQDRIDDLESLLGG